CSSPEPPPRGGDAPPLDPAARAEIRLPSADGEPSPTSGRNTHKGTFGAFAANVFAASRQRTLGLHASRRANVLARAAASGFPPRCACPQLVSSPAWRCDDPQRHHERLVVIAPAFGIFAALQRNRRLRPHRFSENEPGSTRF